jgi:hypothetical protein
MNATDIGDPNPMLAKVCAQTDLVCFEDEETGEPLWETQHEETCGRDLVFERHGDEVVYMCTEHGWQATVFAQGSDDATTP